MVATVRLTGWTAIEVAERAGLHLSKAGDPTEGAREGLTPDEARAVAAEDPSLIFVDLPVSGGRIDVGGGRVWVDHPEHGWIEMPARYSSDGITEEDLVMDCQMRLLPDREVRDISQGDDPIDAITAELDRLDAGGDDGIEAEAHPAGVRVYDTQESAVYEPAAALAALRALPDGAGFDGAWQALARLEESL